MREQICKMWNNEKYKLLTSIMTVIIVLVMIRTSDRVQLVLLVLFYCMFLLTMRMFEKESRKKDEVSLKNAEMEKEMAQAELRQKKQQLLALQNQINPHFLYNTLDTFRGVALESGNRELCDMIEALSSMFKYSVNCSTEMVNINAELDYLEKYIQLQQLRFPGRFIYTEDIKCTAEQLMLEMCPRFVLQPIAENAIHHGLHDVRKGASITVRMEIREDIFCVVIEDNGCGISECKLDELNERLSKMEEKQEQGIHGIGMDNVNKRIKMYCGKEYGVYINSALGIGTKVEIRLPLYKEARQKML